MKSPSVVRIAQIADSHVLCPGKLYFDNIEARTGERLECVINHINQLNPKPDLVIHTGDLVGNGNIETYQYAYSLMNKLEVPYCITCGNHDDFKTLKQVFSHHTYFQDPHFSHYVIGSLPVTIIVLDTKV